MGRFSGDELIIGHKCPCGIADGLLISKLTYTKRFAMIGLKRIQNGKNNQCKR
jgi:hypothetical protein